MLMIIYRVNTRRLCWKLCQSRRETVEVSTGALSHREKPFNAEMFYFLFFFFLINCCKLINDMHVWDSL